MVRARGHAGKRQASGDGQHGTRPSRPGRQGGRAQPVPPQGPAHASRRGRTGHARYYTEPCHQLPPASSPHRPDMRLPGPRPPPWRVVTTGELRVSATFVPRKGPDALDADLTHERQAREACRLCLSSPTLLPPALPPTHQSHRFRRRRKD